MRTLLYIIILFTTIACNKDVAKKDDLSVTDLYHSAASNMKSGNLKQSLELFEKAEQEYPYSPWATRAKIMQIYCHYLLSDYESVTINADAFLKLHPAHQDADYVLYMKALSYYDRIPKITKDQEYAKNALELFEKLISTYSISEYAKDSRIKMDLIKDHLAGKEMDIGRYYLRQKNYIAALNRFQNVIKFYQTTSHTQESLYRMVEIFASLGISDEATKYATVLGANYPESTWYDHSISKIKF